MILIPLFAGAFGIAFFLSSLIFVDTEKEFVHKPQLALSAILFFPGWLVFTAFDLSITTALCGCVVGIAFYTLIFVLDRHYIRKAVPLIQRAHELRAEEDADYLM